MSSTVSRALDLVLSLGSKGQEELWRELQRHGVPVLRVTPDVAVTMGRGSGGSDFLRDIASQDTREAFRYADLVDAACQTPELALQYAFKIDKCVREDTRAAACADPHMAYLYALRVQKKSPSDETRAGTLADPEWAMAYAWLIDQCFREDTWAAVQGTKYEVRYRHHILMPLGV